MTELLLPAEIAAQDFYALHDDLPTWRGAIEALAAELGSGTVV